MKPTFKEYLINEARLANTEFLNLVSQEFAAYANHEFRENLSQTWTLSKSDFIRALKEFSHRLGQPHTEETDIVKSYEWKGPGDWYIQLWDVKYGEHELHIWTDDYIELEKQYEENINEARLHSGFRKPKETDFEYGRPVRGNTLKRGMLLAAYYRKYNEGTDFIEVLGVTGNDEKYGEGGVKYNSVKEAFQANNVRSLKQLEELDNKNEYGYSHYLVARDLISGDSGPWYYLFEGRWSRGSGAEPLSFTEIHYVPKKDNI